MDINETIAANAQPIEADVIAPAAPVVGTTETGEPVHKLTPPAKPRVKDPDAGAPFDKENFAKLFKRFPEQAREAAQEIIGVPDPATTAARLAEMEIKVARADVVADFGFTKEQAMEIPGGSAEEIYRNAEFAAKFRDEQKAAAPDTGPATATGKPASEKAAVKVYEGNGATADYSGMSLEQMEAEYKRRMRRELGH